MGLIGNFLVVYVFGFCFEKLIVNFFVISLVVFDIIICFFLVFEIFDFCFLMYSGNYLVICKIVCFFEVFCIFCFSILLVCIVFDCYYKICKFFKYIFIWKVKKIFVLMVCFMLVFSWLIVLFYGIEIIVMLNVVIIGKDCVDDDNFKGFFYFVLYFFLFLVIMVCFILVIIVLYCCVYWVIIKWKFSMVGESYDFGIWIINGFFIILSREFWDIVFCKSMSV